MGKYAERTDTRIQVLSLKTISKFTGYAKYVYWCPVVKSVKPKWLQGQEYQNEPWRYFIKAVNKNYTAFCQ